MSFAKRYPYLTLRTAEKLSYARLMTSDEDIISRYDLTLLDNN